MSPDHRGRNQDRVHRRHLFWGLAVSVAAHVLVFLIFANQPLPRSPFAAAGERRGDNRAAQGGGLETVELRPPALEPIPAPPVTVVPEPVLEEVERPEPELRVEPVPAITLAEAFPAAGNPGPERGIGLVRGEGEGDAGTESEGRFGVVPPKPRGLILPPSDRPESVKGREIEVWVYVSARGRVVADSTRLNPSTGDRGFDRRLREHAAGWVFDPAQREGRPVSAWFPYTIIM